MGIPAYPPPAFPPRPRPRQGLMPSPYLDDVISELPEKQAMWPPPPGVGELAGPMPGPPPGEMPTSQPQPRPASLASEDPYLTDQIRESTQIRPIQPPPPMPMQLPGPDPESPQAGQFRVSNLPPGPIPPPDNARQPQSPTTTPELEHYRMLAESRPERSSPKWWQRLAAGAAGGLEGYLMSSPSAAIRSSVRNPGQLSRQIMEGDYPQRLQDWQMDMKSAQDMLEASLDIQKARGAQAVQEAQAWRYRNEPGIKADTSLEVQESRNQGALAKTQAVSAGIQATNAAREKLKLRPVTAEKAEELRAEGYEAAGEDEQGRPLYPESTLLSETRRKTQADRDALNYQLGQDRLKSSETIAEENRKSREKLAKFQAGQAWARQSARLQADLQKAQARGESGEYEKEKILNLAKIENAYHKSIADLGKEYKFADVNDPRTPESLTGPAALQYWTRRLEIEKRLREQKNLMERLYATQKGVDKPYIYQPEEGETYATRKLEELQGKAQGAPQAVQTGQPVGAGQGTESQPPSPSTSGPARPRVSLSPDPTTPGVFVNPANGARYRKNPNGGYSIIP